MTPQRAKELLPVIQAFINGKAIQYKDKHMIADEDPPDWRVCFNPSWNDACDYRVAPEKKKGWVLVFKNNNIGTTIHPTKELAGTFRTFGTVAIIEIEYEEGQGL